MPEEGVFEQYQRKGLGRRVGFGSTPAVIIVDLTEGFTNPESPLGSNLDAVVNSSAKLLEAARANNVPVTFTTVGYAPDEHNVFIGKVPSLKTLELGTRWTEIDHRLAPRETEPVLLKKFASAFFGTTLESWLRARNIDTLIVCGATTSGCIRATVVDGLQHNLHVIVPKECVGDRAQGPHEANLLDMDSKYADVVTLEDVLGYFGVSVAPAHAAHDER